MWIAFRFCIFVLWTQYISNLLNIFLSCELLSDFVYSFFEHNRNNKGPPQVLVVNCFQILYIRSLNTIEKIVSTDQSGLWIAFRFCIFVLWTQCPRLRLVKRDRCELLSDFVYSFFEHNPQGIELFMRCSCELLSDFVYSFFEHNYIRFMGKSMCLGIYFL